VEADGETWCWGYNEFGQLGQGELSFRSTSPLLVTSVPAARQVSVRAFGTCAITTTDEVWCWGNALPSGPREPTPTRVDLGT
jgi:alpha-tubulin suppressor-like RCC1 family protein